MVSSESNIIKGLKKGDAKAFAYIYKLHYQPLCYFAWQLIGDKEDATDVVAEVFIKIWERRQQFDALSSVKAFLYIATRNACFDFLKSRKRSNASKKDYAYWMEDRGGEITGLMFNAELAQILNEEIERLPQKCRAIFKLSYFDGLKSEDIARQLQISIQTVWNQKTKATRLIRTGFLKRSLVLFLFFLNINR
jgi:RNA polymerase sigma-70 factor (ECF subfamily)